ncbi:MAG TPA: hypothetical protein VGD37_26000 [Kofleriaceae bacterium]
MRTAAIPMIAALAAGCGDNGRGGGGGHDDGGTEPPGARLVYTDPDHGALRLIHDPAGTSAGAVVLAFVVGDQPLAGYAAGFNLPLDARRVKLAAFTPGTGLDPGGPPLAAQAVIPAQGPLAGMLVTAQSQKASGAGAVTGDTALPPHTVLYTLRLELADGATAGVVLDGSAAGFALPSGGLRNRLGTAVVQAGEVGIGKLEIR